MRTRLLAALAALLGGLLAAPVARADHHERVKITPIRRAGAVVGARVTLTLRASSSYHGKSVQIALGAGHRNTMEHPAHRTAATQMSAGYLRHQWPVQTAAALAAEQVTLELTYGKGNTLVGGETVDVLSTWNRGATLPDGSPFWHVYGMTAGQFGDAETPVYTLPGGPGSP